MDRFEYAVGLISLIVGLGLADIAVSLHRLIKARGRVKWDGLALIAAGFAAFTMVWIWYNIWSLREFAGLTQFWFYLSLLLEMFLLFLAAAAVLPDESELNTHETWNLAAYYDHQRGYIWTLFALFFASYAVRWTYFVVDKGRALTAAYWFEALLVWAPVGLAVALASAPGRRTQTILLSALLLLKLVTVWNATL